MIWNDLRKIIIENDSFLISSHENPDGDSVCSQLAFWKYLKNIGKSAEIYNKDKVPEKFRFISNSQAISDIAPDKKFDVLAIFDSSNPQRTAIENIETRFADKIINIDHHRDNSNFGNINCVDTKSAAACRILYDFFTENGINYDIEITNYLFCGILTDTNGFRFNNDDGSLYPVAYDLIKHGADNGYLFKKMFASYSPSALKLRAKVWESLKSYCGGRINTICIPKKLYEEYGADNSATEGMSNAVLDGEGVEVGIFVRFDDAKTHFSIRSAGKIDVGEIAAAVGAGGGHKFAAGCTIKNMHYEKAIEIIVKKIEDRLNNL
ncbi:MAG: DHH family phosphoesterase [Chitinispirillales bacterium]|jgi:phosphoesterase RecJ-like protein|nr:DHH family phosphoesterase [Chitinispirillales bacterium]